MTSDGLLDDEDVHYCILHMDILIVMLSTWLACTFEKTRVATCCKWKGRGMCKCSGTKTYLRELLPPQTPHPADALDTPSKLSAARMIDRSLNANLAESDHPGIECIPLICRPFEYHAVLADGN